MSAYILLIFGFATGQPVAIDVQTIHQCEAVYKQVEKATGQVNVDHVCIKRQQLPLTESKRHSHK
jgi:hypothetical protein